MHRARLLTGSLVATNRSTLCWQSMDNDAALKRPVENSIREKLQVALKPLFCDVINESYMHNVPKGSETHFKIAIASEKFDQRPLIEQHRMVYELLQAELKAGVHSLTITTRTSKSTRKLVQMESPACRGGFGK